MGLIFWGQICIYICSWNSFFHLSHHHHQYHPHRFHHQDHSGYPNTHHTQFTMMINKNSCWTRVKFISYVCQKFRNVWNQNVWHFSCGYFILVLLQSPIVMEMNQSTRVPNPTALQSISVQSNARAMPAQPFTDKLIRNICRSHWRLFCIFVTHWCVYLCASHRYISVYLLLISSDSPKLARSIKTELIKQNLFPCL